VVEKLLAIVNNKKNIMKNFLIILLGLLTFACNSGTDNKDGNNDTTLRNTTPGTAAGGNWTNEDQVNFMDNCISEAGRNISRDSAQAYCACMLTRAQQNYPDYQQANSKMTMEQMNSWAEDCLGN
jgi:hypothetical protein